MNSNAFAARRGPSLTASHPRVLYLIDSLSPGGAERSLADMAPRIVGLGIDMEIAVLVDRPGLTPELEAKGISVHQVGGNSRAVQLGRLIRLLHGQRPDLLHTTLFESDVLGRLAATVLRIPVVTTLANIPYGPEHAREYGVKPIRLRAAKEADALTARTVRRFHAVSQATADTCIQRLRIDADRVDVIPRGRDHERLGHRTRDRRQKVRRRLGLAPEVPVIIAVGRQEPQKGFDVLIRAVPEVLKSEPSAVLLLVGREARETERLRALSAELHTSESVRFLGERDDVPDLISASDVFVLSSYREGLPGVVLEAMALEAPIVASDLPTVREAVPGPEYAILVPAGREAELAAGIVKTLTDRDEATRRVAAGRRRFLTTFDIDAISVEMADFYRRALSS